MKFLKNSSLLSINLSRTATLVLLSVTSHANALEPYHAEYQFNIDKYLTSTASRDLSKEDDNTWKYVFKSNVLKVGKATETAVFNINDGQVVPQSHSMNIKIPLSNRNSTLTFNQGSNKIDVVKNGKSKSYPLQKEIEDELSVEIQIRLDLMKGKIKPFYYVADDSKVDKIPFINEGEETITTPAGTYKAVKIRRVHELKTLTTLFWLAPSLDYLPVRIMHHDERHYNMTYTMNLAKYVPSASK